MKHEAILQALERHNWKRTAIDLLAAIGAITLTIHNEDVQRWLRSRDSAPQATVTPAGLPVETIRSIEDQIGGALRNGGLESFVEGTLVCSNGTEVHNPIDVVLSTGQRVAVARIPANDGKSLDVMVIDTNAPGSPYTYGTVRCAFLPTGDEQATGLQFGQVYDFHFNQGDPEQPVHQATGKPFIDDSGHVISIGMLSPTP